MLSRFRHPGSLPSPSRSYYFKYTHLYIGYVDACVKSPAFLATDSGCCVRFGVNKRFLDSSQFEVDRVGKIELLVQWYSCDIRQSTADCCSLSISHEWALRMNEMQKNLSSHLVNLIVCQMRQWIVSSNARLDLD